MNILLAGVGGQGIILASRAIAEAALAHGLPVKTAETIGMAQREGPVVSHIRIGTPSYGPLIPRGGADILLACEPAEGVRNLHFLRPGGQAVISTAPVVPVSVSLGGSSYDPAGLLRWLKDRLARIYCLDAAGLAEEAGNIKALNMVMLGALSTFALPFPGEELLAAALRLLPPATHTVNGRAFTLGRQELEVQAR